MSFDIENVFNIICCWCQNQSNNFESNQMVKRLVQINLSKLGKEQHGQVVWDVLTTVILINLFINNVCF